MIAVLRRQLVKKRAPRAKRPPAMKSVLKAVLKSGGSSSAFRARVRFAPFRKPVRPAVPQTPPEERALSGLLGSQRERKGPPGSRHELKSLAGARARIWAIPALCAVLLLCIFVPAIAMRARALPRPVLPVTADTVAELYRTVLPEEEAAAAASAVGAGARLSSVNVNRYTVKKGESLSQIAAKLGLNLDTLVSYNGITDARSLSAGTVLQYPNANGLKYTVRRGDTLDKIAHSYSVSLDSLLDWNELTSSVITVGQVVFVPGARMSAGDLNRALGNLFVWPVAGRISSRFGQRNSPLTGVEKFHNGVDIAAKMNTPISAAMAGRIASVGFNTVYGRYVIIKHVGTGFQTMYAHLDKTSVSRDQNVAQGQKIGESGNTGMTTGPHLHFSIFKNNEPVDPLAYLK
jgi:murein DD-endopeptidase MepM/ murein hydrolase activator NlpD